mgnify:CR=1 FL=1
MFSYDLSVELYFELKILKILKYLLNINYISKIKLIIPKYFKK